VCDLNQSERAVTALDGAYAVVAAADTVLAARDDARPSRWRWLTKPALMPLLAAKVSSADGSAAAPMRARTRDALVLSWAGDVALLGTSDAAFGAGLGCFAAAHGRYATAFGSAQGAQPPAAAGPVTVAGTGLGGILARRAGRLGVPVAGYSALITAMAVRALGVDPNQVGRPAATRIAAGAGLFVVSDGLIGLRKFGLPAGTSRRVRSAIDATVMATYAAGQWLIADGVARAAPPGGRR
jgi:uncharacterized membrane protein YhhN